MALPAPTSTRKGTSRRLITGALANAEIAALQLLLWRSEDAVAAMGSQEANAHRKNRRQKPDEALCCLLLASHMHSSRSQARPVRG